MRFLRPIFFAAFALLFVFATNRCVIAAALPGEGEKCCEQEHAPGGPDRGFPCDGRDCAPCATLESGVNLATLVPFTAPMPVWTEVYDFAELMRLFTAILVGDVSEAPPDPEEIPPPPWCDVMMKALPVRGPSLLA